jgi:hypothetical protein
MSKAKTIELAMKKVATLPEAAQERIGLEVLEQIDSFAELRTELEIGIKQLDAGLGEELNMDDVIAQARAEYEK